MIDPNDASASTTAGSRPMKFKFVNYASNVGYVITREIGGIEHVRTSNGLWVAFDVEHIIPIPDPTPDVLGCVRAVDEPPDTRDGDTLIVFEGVGSSFPLVTEAFNLLTGIPVWGPRINQIRVR